MNSAAAMGWTVHAEGCTYCQAASVGLVLDLLIAAEMRITGSVIDCLEGDRFCPVGLGWLKAAIKAHLGEPPSESGKRGTPDPEPEPHGARRG